MFETYQRQVDGIVSQFETPYWQPLEILARLTEETGEVARITNHMYGAKKKKTDENMQNLGEELVDVMYTVICYANSQGINLDSAWSDKMKKQSIRDKDRFAKKGTDIGSIVEGI